MTWIMRIKLYVETNGRPCSEPVWRGMTCFYRLLREVSLRWCGWKTGDGLKMPAGRLCESLNKALTAEPKGMRRIPEMFRTSQHRFWCSLSRESRQLARSRVGGRRWGDMIKDVRGTIKSSGSTWAILDLLIGTVEKVWVEYINLGFIWVAK